MVKRAIMISCILVVMIFSFGLTVFAEDGEIEDQYSDMLDRVPDDIVELLPDDIFSFDADSIGSSASDLISWEYVLDTVFDLIGLNIGGAVKALAMICSVLSLCSLLNMMNKSVKNEAMLKTLELVGAAATVGVVMEVSEKPISDALTVLNNISIFVNTSSPLICSLYAAGGNISGALVHSYGLIAFLSILENVCMLALQTIVGACMALALSSSFVSGTSLLQLSNAIKRGFTFFVGLMMLIFTAVISTQSVLASKSDSLSSRTAKMLASQMIPIVGSTVGETLRTAGASVEYLRSSVGIIMIVILILTVAPTFISMLAYRAAFMIGNGIAGLLDCKREGQILLEISSIFGYVIAILSVCSIVLVLLMTIFAKCTSPIA